MVLITSVHLRRASCTLFSPKSRWPESINNFIKTRYVDRKDLEETDKIIEIGKYTDVYNIYDTLTNNYIGILYIKGLKQSKAMKNLLLNKNKIILRCKFNNDFKKWEPII